MTRITPAMTRLAATSILSLALALPLAAQETSQDTQGSDRVTAEEIRAEFDEAFETIRSYSEDQRDEAVDAMRETLSGIDSEIARLEQQARENWAGMSEATQEQTRETLNALRDRRNELSEAFGAMQESSRSAWDQVQDGVAHAWSEVRNAWTAIFDDTAASTDSET